ncbi:hypothetical protein Sango_2533300 [Sesamum angolense]|uniref:Eukaryotic translation initiation factor 3 30 kDa subunit n=1 Tax=Sesamum angolense TaxID=2727404 RepID=A0AAE2BIF9_9LAMI|nr:hypothetical protein Sango_2533300 [Sesamum angolense]
MDDEDVEDNDVKDSWEDEDEDEPAPAPKAEPPAPEKASKKTAVKSVEKKGKAVEVAKEAPLDPIAEKLRQQRWDYDTSVSVRLVEEADYKSTAELFAKKGDEKTLDNFIPKTESDFLEYAELVANKLRPFEKSYHYIGLLKAVMRLSLTSLKGADAKEVASSVTAIANEKIKAEKEANAGKRRQVERRNSCMLASRKMMWLQIRSTIMTIMILCEQANYFQLGTCSFNIPILESREESTNMRRILRPVTSPNSEMVMCSIYFG